jgi:hypothetical protein
MFSCPTIKEESGNLWPLFYTPGYYTLDCQANAKSENCIIPSNYYGISI